MNNNLGKRVIYLDILRILAALAVMMIHICGQNLYKADVYSSEWAAINFYDAISRWAVSGFVMISGALFLRKTRSIKQIYTKYILRIVTAYLFWASIYAALDYDPKLGVKGFLLDVIKGHYHMWFLFMIVGLYMIVPFLKKIVENKTLMDYFIVLGMCFTYIIPAAVQALSIYSPNYAGYVSEAVGKLSLYFVVGFSVLYLLGYRLSTGDIGRRTTMMIVIAGLAGFVLTIGLTAWISHRDGRANELFYNNLTLNVLMESVLIFVGARKLFEGYTPSARMEAVITKLSGLTFGAFLVHPMIIKCLKKTSHLNTLTFHPVLSIPLILLIVAAVSFAITAIIDRIPYLRKFVI